MKRSQRAFAFIIAFALTIFTFNGGLFASRPALAAEEQSPHTAVRVNFDFNSVQSMDKFKDNVWVYQWDKNGGSVGHKIPADPGFVLIKPLNGESTVNFIVAIGTYDDKGIHPWYRWGANQIDANQAQTGDFKGVKPGRAIDVTYDNLVKNAVLPQVPTDADTYTPSYPEAITVAQGGASSSQPLTFSSYAGNFSADNVGAQPGIEQADQRLHATISPDGTVSVRPDSDLEVDTYTVTVGVVYPQDNSKDTVTINVNVTERPITKLEYESGAVSVPQGSSQTMPLTTPLNTLPAGTTFALDQEYHSAISVDPQTGALTIAPASDAQLGEYPVTVIGTSQGQKVAEGQLTIAITEKKTNGLDSKLWSLSYESLTVQQLKAANVKLTATLFGKERALPQGVTFAEGDNMHKWVTVNPKTGEVTATPDEFVAAQDYTFNVAVTHPDKTVTQVPVKITVTKAPATDLDTTVWEFSYNKLNVAQKENQSVEIAASLFGKESSLPHGITFAKGEKMPSWITVDSETGTVTATPDEYVAAQDYEFSVIVTHLNDKVTTVPVKVTVTQAENTPDLKSQLWKLSYADLTVQQLKTASVDLSATLFGQERALPSAVTFAKGADMPSWITVHEKTGTVTANPSEYVELKDYVFHVVVTHLDGATEKVAVKIKVTEADPETTYPLTPLKPGKHTIPALELTPAQPKAKPQAPKPVEKPGLAKTGINLTGLAGLALISTLTGAAITRRRKA